MRRPINRVMPVLPVTKMVTHAILAPTGSHWRKATCAEIECEHHAKGWGLNTAGLTEEQLWAAKHSGRRFAVTHDEQGAEVLLFEPGQECFRAGQHRVRIEREPWFVRRSGDWRGNPDGPKAEPLVFSGADAWRDSVHTFLDRCTG